MEQGSQPDVLQRVFARHALPALQINRSYKTWCLLTGIARDSFVETRLSFTYAGGAILTLAIRFVLSLLASSEAVLLPRFDAVIALFAEHSRMRALGPAASCEHIYSGFTGTDNIWKSETAENMLSYLKTYHELTGRCASLAASPRVKDAAPAPGEFASTLKAITMVQGAEELSALYAMVSGSNATDGAKNMARLATAAKGKFLKPLQMTDAGELTISVDGADDDLAANTAVGPNLSSSAAE